MAECPAQSHYFVTVAADALTDLLILFVACKTDMHDSQTIVLLSDVKPPVPPPHFLALDEPKGKPKLITTRQASLHSCLRA